MKNKGKNVCIVLFIVTTIIAGGLATYFGIMEYKGKERVLALQNQVAELESQKNIEDNKDDSIPSEENSQNLPSEIEISEENLNKIIKTTIEDGVNLWSMVRYTSDCAITSKYLNFYNSEIELQEHITIIDGRETTDIKYEDFVNKITKYITNEFYEREFLNKRYANVNGLLALIRAGGSGKTYTIENMELISKEENKYNYKVNFKAFALGAILEESYNVTVKNIDDSYLVDDIVKNN